MTVAPEVGAVGAAEPATNEVDPPPFVAGSCRICSPVIQWHVWTGNRGGEWRFLPFNINDEFYTAVTVLDLNLKKQHRNTGVVGDLTLKNQYSSIVIRNSNYTYM